MSETPKKKNTAMIVIGGLVILALVGGAIFLFSKAGEKEKTTSTQTDTTSNTGLSGLLGGLNLSGLTLFGI